MPVALPRTLTNTMRKCFHAFMPDFVKKSRLVNKAIITIFMGRWYDMEWKKRFRDLSEDEWARYYDFANQKAFRDEDTTANQKLAVLEAVAGKKVLEAGAGTGHLSVLMAKKCFDVTALDCSRVVLGKAAELAAKNNVKLKTVRGFLEKLPFKGKGFDTVVCCHTLEHVKDLKKSINELKRVARRRLIIIVPEQEYQKYTTDLHTYFFPNKESLVKAIGLEHYICKKLDNDIFYVGFMSKTT